jgi:tetratricopeptide (TPR) repeat protein
MTDLNAKDERATATDLLRNVFADIDATLITAQDLLTVSSDPLEQSILRQTIAIAFRERGDVPAAVLELRTSMRLAGQAHDKSRRADAQATLGATLAFSGHTQEGLRHLDEAVAVLRGHARAAALTRRAWIYLALLARYREASIDLRKAYKSFARHDDLVWQARALNFLGYALLGLGDLSAADRYFENSGRISERLQHRIDYAYTVQNRGFVAFVNGDIPRTLTLLDEASAAFADAGHPSADLVVDKCTAYLGAGMLQEADDTVNDALSTRSWPARELAELQGVRAQVSLARGDYETATRNADRAARLFRAQGRDWFAARARLVALTARTAKAHRISPQLRHEAMAIVEETRELRMPELTQALLLAATIVRRNDPNVADQFLAEAERTRNHDAALTRAMGWLAAARRRAAAAQPSLALRACERGLSAIDEHQALLGSTELRALASAHGQELASLALSTAIAMGQPRRTLYWAERWRGTATTTPPATSNLDEQTLRDLAALRTHAHRASTARDSGRPSIQSERLAADLEYRIRQRHLRRSGLDPASSRASVSELLRTLRSRDTTLIELVGIAGQLYALVARDNKVRQVYVGSVDDALKAQDFARYMLRQAGRGRPSSFPQMGLRLENAVLGDAVPLLGSGPVVISTSNRLHRVPWGLMPCLAERPVSSTPSADLWLRAAATVAHSTTRVFVVGPGLASNGAEVSVIKSQDPEATFLDGTTSTVEASLSCLDGAGLAHIAAHGRFREDNPLFSAIELADGPMMVHDLERLNRPPHRIVLSACESGEMHPVGADELLGLSISLLSMGSAGVISSLVKVHDEATAEVMVSLHAALREGASAPASLTAARERAKDDPLLAATVASFVAFGA